MIKKQCTCPEDPHDDKPFCHIHSVSTEKKDSWTELNQAIKKIWIKSINGSIYNSKAVPMTFNKEPSNNKEISLVIFGIDNKYKTELGEFHWEIFLNKDGTWELK